MPPLGDDQAGVAMPLGGPLRGAGAGADAATFFAEMVLPSKAADVVRVLSGLAARTDRSMLFTFAPSSAFLQAFLAVGRLVPRGDRSPAIVPVAERTLRRLIAAEPAMAGWTSARTHRVARGFYTSQALEVLRG